MTSGQGQISTLERRNKAAESKYMGQDVGQGHPSCGVPGWFSESSFSAAGLLGCCDADANTCLQEAGNIKLKYKQKSGIRKIFAEDTPRGQQKPVSEITSCQWRAAGCEISKPRQTYTVHVMTV